MKYPNLAAEVEVGGYSKGMWHRVLADEVNVTENLLDDIVFGQEEPSRDEALALYRSLAHYPTRNGYSMGYLFAPKLATIPPGTNRARARYTTLRRLVGEAESLLPSHWCLGQREEAKDVLGKMDQGRIVTYARYRHCAAWAKNTIAERAKYIQRPPRRGAGGAA